MREISDGPSDGPSEQDQIAYRTAHAIGRLKRKYGPVEMPQAAKDELLAEFPHLSNVDMMEVWKCVRPINDRDWARNYAIEKS